MHARNRRRWDKRDRWHIGVIGGSGLADGIGLDDAQEIEVASPFGTPSGPVTTGFVGGVRFTFLARHGAGHRLPPSAVNYRANIDVLKRCGVTDVLSLSAIGSLREELAPGHFIAIDQFIDRTVHREHSFFGPGLVAHVSLADPVCPMLASLVLSGELDLAALPADDEEAIALLTRIKGIGRWSAEIYLLFAEGRPDAFPAGDLAVQIEIARLLGRDEKLPEKELRALSEAWRPHRGAAAILAWHSYNSTGTAL